MKRLILISSFFTMLFLSNSAFAVTFKCMNDTKYTFRMRVHDRGIWRPWVTISSNSFEYVAPKVERTKHSVEIEMLINRKWELVYSNKHGSKAWSRIAQIIEIDGDIALLWWDEPGGGCRDWPINPNKGRYKSCLKPSGDWWGASPKKAFMSAVKWGGKSLATYVIKSFW